jgi:hypothetical protein
VSACVTATQNELIAPCKPADDAAIYASADSS